MLDRSLENMVARHWLSQNPDGSAKDAMRFARGLNDLEIADYAEQIDWDRFSAPTKEIPGKVAA